MKWFILVVFWLIVLAIYSVIYLNIKSSFIKSISTILCIGLMLCSLLGSVGVSMDSKKKAVVTDVNAELVKEDSKYFERKECTFKVDCKKIDVVVPEKYKFDKNSVVPFKKVVYNTSSIEYTWYVLDKDFNKEKDCDLLNAFCSFTDVFEKK